MKEAVSRTAKMAKNARVALLFYFLSVAANFFSRKIFIDRLGAEVLGLNTTAQNLLGFLNLAELGISAAIAFTLYKPLFDEDRACVNEIVSIQGWFYRRVGAAVFLGALVVSAFFPLIFSKTELPLWYAYGSFGALIFSALLGYIFNYRQIVLTAAQKDYKVTFCVQGARLAKVAAQIAAIAWLNRGYESWIVLEIVFGVAQTLLLSRTIWREYPWLKTDTSRGRELMRRHPQILKKTAQVFFHRIGGFVLFQSTPLVVYAFTSLTLVAVYGNYVLIATGISSAIGAVFNSLTAGVGNLVAEGNSQRTLSVFWGYAVLRFWLAGTVCFSMAQLAAAFVTLWVGAEFVLPPLPFALFVAYYFIQFTRVSDGFLAAFGLFQDIAAPVIEAALCLGCAILFGRIWGLSGVLAGVLVGQISVIVCWKPYFLFTRGFKRSVFDYAKKALGCLALIAVSWFCCEEILRIFFHGNAAASWFSWSVSAMGIFALNALVSAALFYAASGAFRRVCARVLGSISAAFRNRNRGGGRIIGVPDFLCGEIRENGWFFNMRECALRTARRSRRSLVF